MSDYELSVRLIEEAVTVIISVSGIIIVLILLCSCRRRNKGKIISHPPPAPPGPLKRAPYPQQQVVVAYPDTVTSPDPAYPTHMLCMEPESMEPAPDAPWPHPAPAHALLSAHTHTHTHTHTLHDPPATTSPDLHAFPPPSYEQATGADCTPEDNLCVCSVEQ